jgi:3-oxosteroid 1-dehydrogenase
MEVDLLCLGGGLGGLAAAVRAHDLGSEVLVAERSDVVGGVAAYSGGFVWVGRDLDAAERYLDHVQGPRPVDRVARRHYLAAAVEATEWFRAAGVPFTVIPGCADLYHPAPGSTTTGRLWECVVPAADVAGIPLRRGPFYAVGTSRATQYGGEPTPSGMLTHGMGLAAGFAREALVRRGIPFLLDAAASDLLVEAGAVVGAVVGGTPVRARKGVLLATGGYGWSAEAAELEDVAGLVESAPPVSDGSAVALAEQAGAGLHRGADPFFSVGHAFPGETHPGTDTPLVRPLLEHLGLPHSMIVNAAGERFGDESYYGSLIGALRGNSPNTPCWFLADATFAARYRFGPHGPGERWGLEAESLADLASAAGISAEGLERTVATFNADARTGHDRAFGRGSLPFVRTTYGDAAQQPNPCLGPLETPPFRAVPLDVVGFGMGTLGLRIDGDARVLRRDGSPVPGLYATGNAAATRELAGYVTGLANARNHTYAYLAATHAHGRTA